MADKTKAKKPEGAQIGLRLDHEIVKRLDVLKAQLSIPGLALGRADVVRVAVVAGLEVLEKKHRPKGT